MLLIWYRHARLPPVSALAGIDDLNQNKIDLIELRKILWEMAGANYSDFRGNFSKMWFWS